MQPRSRPLVALALVAFAPGVLAADARADEEAPETSVSGIVRPESDSDSTLRAVGSAALFVPRETLAVLFLGTSTAATILQEDSAVPRFGNLAQGATRLYVFPTLFAETNSIFSVGGRMIAASDDVATSVRAGIGGLKDTEVESRVLVRASEEIPFAFGFETLFLRSSDNEYAGIGQDPESDSRNRFRAGAAGEAVTYDERRERAIASLGARPIRDLEIAGTISLDRRSLDDQDNGSLLSFDQVFAPGSVPGSHDPTRIYYGELAVRMDSRFDRGGLQRGFLFEVYGGLENELKDSPAVSLARVGGTAGAFIPIFRRTNILAPRIFLDGLAQRDDVPVPFTELPLQPQFRGAGTRRDFVSLVGNLDYRWGFTSNLGARIFVDGATVGPAIDELEVTSPRIAAGAGIDVWSTGADLGSFSVAGGPDGVAFHLAFGVSSGFSDDRQHRD